MHDPTVQTSSAALEIDSNNLFPAATLYFGCRSEHKDQHYVAEWKAWSENGQITYRVAFSPKKMYSGRRFTAEHLESPMGFRRVFRLGALLSDDVSLV